MSSKQTVTSISTSINCAHHTFLLQVMVYDVAAQETLWCTQPGHTETIFACSFAPAACANPHLLASCSFDGTVRVWNTSASSSSSSCVKTLDTKAPGVEEAVVKGEGGAVFGGPSGTGVVLKFFVFTQQAPSSLRRGEGARWHMYGLPPAHRLMLHRYTMHSSSQEQHGACMSPTAKRGAVHVGCTLLSGASNKAINYSP